MRMRGYEYPHRSYGIKRLYDDIRIAVREFDSICVYHYTYIRLHWRVGAPLEPVVERQFRRIVPKERQLSLGYPWSRNSLMFSIPRLSDKAGAKAPMGVTHRAAFFQKIQGARSNLDYDDERHIFCAINTSLTMTWRSLCLRF
jgi:hypothetical protein